MTEEHYEFDPLGKSAHSPGAKLDAGKNRLGLVLHGFSRALWAVGEVGTYGADKYTTDGWIHVPDGINRYTDAMYRHLIKDQTDGPIDAESGLLHAAQAAWNALARLDLMLRLVDAQAAAPTSAKVELPAGNDTQQHGTDHPGDHSLLGRSVRGQGNQASAANGR